MPLWRKQWRVVPRAPQALFERYASFHPLVVQVLFNRGLTTVGEIQSFLDRTVSNDNPFDLQGMVEAVALIRNAIVGRQTIAVYGDYDVDGITATAIMTQTLESLGCAVLPYIPDRVEEGYGLNPEALQTLAEQDVRLLITVDCGTRSLDEIALARQLGMTVVITDHHHVGQVLPNANAVLNPRRADCVYPFKDLSGAGVAFKLAQALLRVNAQVPLPTTQFELAEETLLDLVALGTVADMVPLLGENHVLVQAGLEILNAALRPGLAALMQLKGIDPGKVQASTISFVLAPRLNAAGRVGEASTAYRLLVAPDLSTALPLARELESLNRERQELTTFVQEKARAMVLDMENEAPLLFAASSDFPAGIIGLAAGRLCEEFYRPVVVIEEGTPYSKGSARSIPEFHITEALDSMSDLFVRYGGHAAAAGFTIHTGRLLELQERLLVLAREQLVDVSLTPSLQVDAEVPLHELSWDTYRAMERLAPFGYGNPHPLLMSRGARVADPKAVGLDGRHLRFYVLDERGTRWSAIAFRQGDWIERLPDTVDLAYHLVRNDWNGRSYLQLKVQDIHPAQ
ncbi:MAG: single-stranded-DNA-specific exonuclease RecJ [Anaerolineae bacterium]|nr:single-stranded-DNA-specific exonuclease RecJ [Anaerolineae bacterium]